MSESNTRAPGVNGDGSASNQNQSKKAICKQPVTLLAFAIVIILLAIIVPCAVIIPRNNATRAEQSAAAVGGTSGGTAGPTDTEVSSPSSAPSIMSVTASTTTPSAAAASSKAPSIPPSSLQPTPPNDATPISEPGTIVEGATSQNNIGYYHCTSAVADPIHIVLLHGASFDKSIWVSTGILEDFCSSGGVSVTALDLPVSAGNEPLRGVLDDLYGDASLQATKPVVLVTPSASGYSMVDWMINGDITQIPEYIQTWIPVAPVSLPSASDEQITAAFSSTPVLAIYGDGDTSGGRLSERLGSVVDATVVELVGGHPAYRDSPVEFVDVILNFIGL